MRAWWLWAALAATLLLCGCGLIAGVTDVPEVASSEDAGADAPIDTGSPQDTGMARDSAPDAPQVGDSAGDTADAGPPMDTSPPPTYTVGGTVSGLIGTMVVLMDNGGDPLTVSGNGPFVFSSGLAGGTTYDVTVTTGVTQ